MIAKILAGVLVASLAASGFLAWRVARQETTIATQGAQIAHLTAELATAEERVRQARAAQMAAAEYLSRARVTADEYERLKDTLRGMNNDPLPLEFRCYLRRLGFGVRPGDPGGNPDCPAGGAGPAPPAR